MTIDCIYYNDFIRCFRDGRVERIHQKRPKNGWYEVENIANHNDRYNVFEIDHKKVLRHRLIAYCFLGLEDLIIKKDQSNSIDHINRNPLDNRVSNLRIVTNSENAQNKKNVKGYYYCKERKCYYAQIKLNYKRIYLGRFDTEIEARNAYLKAKEKYHKYSPII